MVPRPQEAWGGGLNTHASFSSKLCMVLAKGRESLYTQKWKSLTVGPCADCPVGVLAGPQDPGAAWLNGEETGEGSLQSL